MKFIATLVNGEKVQIEACVLFFNNTKALTFLGDEALVARPY